MFWGRSVGSADTIEHPQKDRVHISGLGLGGVINPPGFMNPPGSINAKGRRLPKSMLEFPRRLTLEGAILKVIKECTIINSARGG